MDGHEEGFYDGEADIEERSYIDAYFEAGYDYDYAVELAEYWGYETPHQAKITKGKVIVEGVTFPPQANQDDHTAESVEETGDFDI